MSKDKKHNDGATGFFIKPKKRPSGAPSPDNTENTSNEPKASNYGLGIETTLSEPIETPNDAPSSPPEVPWSDDVMIDDATRTKSMRGVAILLLFGLIALMGLTLAVGGVVFTVWSDEISEGLSGAVGTKTQFGGGVDETGIYEKEKQVVRRRASVKDTAVEKEAGPEPVDFILTGEHPMTAVQVKCPSGFTKRVSIYNNRAIIPDVPPESCTADFRAAGVPLLR